MTSSLGVFTDSQAGSFDRCEFDSLTLYCCDEELRLSVAFFGFSLWTVGKFESGKRRFFS
jgi:hypothetical protein